MATVTLLQAMEDLAGALGALIQGTLTASAVGSLTVGNDPAFRSNRSNLDSGAGYAGAEILVTSGTTPVPNPNGIGLHTWSTGVLDPAIDYTTAPDATAAFDLFTRGITRALLLRAINNALRNRRYLTLVPLTLVADGDMEANNTTSWPATNSTITKVTTEEQGRGNRVLRVLATSAVGQSRSVDLEVDPTYQSQFYLGARVRADIGTAKLIAWDLTNGAEIKAESWTSRGWGRINFTFDLPATCELIEIRLESTANADDTYWDDVQLLRLGSKELPCPSWIEDESQVRRVLTSRDEDSLDMDEYVDAFWWDMLPDESNPNQLFRISIEPGVSGPVFIRASRAYDTLSANTDTTYMHREWLKWTARYELLVELSNRGGLEVATWRTERDWNAPVARKWDRLRMPKLLVRRKWPSRPTTPVPTIYG